MNQRQQIALLTLLFVCYCQSSDADKNSKANKGSKNTQKYVVQAKKSHFRVFVYKDGFAKALVDDHVIGAKNFSAVLKYNSDPSKITMSMTIDTNSLAVESQKVEESDKRLVQKKMLEQLNAEQNKRIEFSSTKVKLTSRRQVNNNKAELLRLVITGSLKMNGIEKIVKVPANIIVTKNKLSATGSTEIQQSKWGLDPYRSFLGAVKYKDKMKISFKIVSERQFF